MDNLPYLWIFVVVTMSQYDTLDPNRPSFSNNKHHPKKGLINFKPKKTDTQVEILAAHYQTKKASVYDMIV